MRGRVGAVDRGVHEPERAKFGEVEKHDTGADFGGVMPLWAVLVEVCGHGDGGRGSEGFEGLPEKCGIGCTGDLRLAAVYEG